MIKGILLVLGFELGVAATVGFLNWYLTPIERRTTWLVK